MPRMDFTALEFLSATTIVPDLEESPITPGSSYAQRWQHQFMLLRVCKCRSAWIIGEGVEN
jgi:hypothetical protein